MIPSSFEYAGVTITIKPATVRTKLYTQAMANNYLDYIGVENVSPADDLIGFRFITYCSRFVPSEPVPWLVGPNASGAEIAAACEVFGDQPEALIDLINDALNAVDIEKKASVTPA